MRKFNRTEIISLIIAVGLITRPLWKKIFRKPMEALVVLSDKTKIAWFAFVPVLIGFLFLIKFWMNYLKIIKTEKVKNDKKKQKRLLFSIIFFTIAFIYILGIAIFAQIVLVTRELN